MPIQQERLLALLDEIDALQHEITTLREGVEAIRTTLAPALESRPGANHADACAFADSIAGTVLLTTPRAYVPAYHQERAHFKANAKRNKRLRGWMAERRALGAEARDSAPEKDTP